MLLNINLKIEKLKKYLFTILISIASFYIASATHIKAGDISAKKDPNNAFLYTFTLTIYYETARVTGSGAVPIDNQTMVFSDGTSQSANLSGNLVDVGNGTSKGTFIFVHTFPAVGVYSVGYKEANRIADIKNMSESVNTTFYIDAQIIISPFVPNNTPVLITSPIDIAYTGKIFKHNPGAYDPDGDSLSFELIPPKKSNNIDVDGYLSPADPIFGGKANNGGAPYISINPYTGEVTWDTPGTQGIYNIAIKVTEWRKGQRLGYVVRDMQITVKDGKNNPPKITALRDTCIEAGTSLIKNLTTTDPDKNDVIVTSIGEGFINLQNSLQWASYTPQNRRPTPLIGTITLNTNCNLIRNQPYLFTFKAEDQPPIFDKLTDFYTWNVKVIAPKVKNFTVSVQNNNEAKLTWDLYNYNECSNRNSNNIKIQIIRSRCDSIIFDGTCPEISLPNAELLTTLNVNETSYIDKNLVQSTTYYYTIRVIFNDLQGGLSNWHQVKKITPLKSAALIKSITSLDNQIEIIWKSPLDTSIYQGKNYDITLNYKSKESLNFKSKTINTNNLTGGNFIIDVNPNDSIYFVNITIADQFGKSYTSNTLTSVKLNTIAKKSELELTWKQHQNITTTEYQIFNPKNNTLITKLSVSNDTVQKFSINNLPNCDSSCAVVKAIAYYCSGENNDTVVFTSNKSCQLIRAGTTPILNLNIIPTICANYSCDKPFPFAPYSNTIFWNKPKVPLCDYPNSFNVYYSETDNYNWKLIGNTIDTNWIHSGLSNFAGCYMVKSTNSFGDEGQMSNVVCQDICPCYELPNIISPNGDDKNELFVPLPEPRFVESVKFKVYNRWGQVVYELEDNNQILIKWDAKGISDGVYFYQADVTFSRRAKNADRYKTLKGWVQVVR